MRKFPHEVGQLDAVRGKIVLGSSNESHAILDFSTVFVVEGPRRLRPVVVRGQAICQVGGTSTTHDDDSVTHHFPCPNARRRTLSATILELACIVCRTKDRDRAEVRLCGQQDDDELYFS
jgi:hypothetical protein